MGLSHLTGRSKNVELANGESFSVRGLGFLDIFPIVTAHKDSLAKLFEMYTARGISGVVNDADVLISLLAQTAPSAFRQIVAAGADEPNVAAVDSLPMTAQLDALEKIALLTFEGQGGVKKVSEMVIRVLSSLRMAAEAA